MQIDVTKKYRERGVGNTYNYKTYTQAGVTYTPTPPAIIPFVDTDVPGITDYFTLYFPLYGPYPHFMLVTYDENEKRIYQKDNPLLTEDADGNIDSIAWDLGRLETGFIIMYPTV